jgi:hypothetical protein
MSHRLLHVAGKKNLFFMANEILIGGIIGGVLGGAICCVCLICTGKLFS